MAAKKTGRTRPRHPDSGRRHRAALAAPRLAHPHENAEQGDRGAQGGSEERLGVSALKIEGQSGVFFTIDESKRPKVPRSTNVPGIVLPYTPLQPVGMAYVITTVPAALQNIYIIHGKRGEGSPPGSQGTPWRAGWRRAMPGESSAPPRRGWLVEMKGTAITLIRS